MKKLILLRGIPGSGKTTFALFLKEQFINVRCETIASDDFFMHNGHYHWDGMKIGEAHQWCQETVWQWMAESVPVIIVHNTFTRESELEPYLEMAKSSDYKVISLVVENRHGNTSVHGVPEHTLQKMKARFTLTL